MSRHSRLHVLNSMIEVGVIPVFYHPDVDTARQVIDACYAGGARVVEFTNRGDFAWNAFTELAQHYAQAAPDLVFGVGSIVDAPTAALYLASGANYVVGPSLNAEVARLCNRRKVAYLPGCATASEINTAEELGAEIIKLFPANLLGGPAFVKALKGPCPWSSLMPSGGVEANEENLRAWFTAGAACVGMGANLIVKQDVAAGNFAAITARVAQVVAWIAAIRASLP